MMHGGDIGPDQNICYTREVVPRVYVDVGCCAIDGTKDHRTMRYLVGRLADVSNNGYASLKCGQVGIIYVHLGVFCHEFHVCRYN